MNGMLTPGAISTVGTEDELAVFGAALPAALDAARRAEAAERYA